MRKMKWVLLTLILSFTSAHAMTVKSSEAAPNGVLPVTFTCDGKNVSPEVSWSGAPSGTQSYALIVSDPDAPGGIFYHWVLYNIPKNTTELPEGMSTPPSGATAGTNSWGKSAYNGPCPPKGASHRYIFSVYALDGKVNPGASTDAAALINAMKAHVLQKSDFTMVYSRWAS